MPLAPSVGDPLNDPAYRTKLAEEYGFTQIGEPVPEGITLKKIIDSFPSEVKKFTVFPFLWKQLP
jgi:omega-6 fatty acid desaturase (delta-12 desaturase)